MSAWNLHTNDRDERLAEIATQQAEGTLVIRQMTDEERQRYGLGPATDQANTDATA
jgi:hypothetical protein